MKTPYNILLLLNLIFYLGRVEGQAGMLDTTFGIAGIVLTDIGYGDIAKSIAIQNDDKIIIGGYCGSESDFCLVRYMPNGSLDSTFGNDGIVITDISSEDDIGNSVIIQNDGKIIMAGYGYFDDDADIILTRYDVDGSLDLSFGVSGIIITDLGSDQDYIFSVEMQENGKIVVAGYTGGDLVNDFVLVRYNVDGLLDNSFDDDGIVITDFGSSQGALCMAIQSDNKFVLGGWDLNANSDFAVARFNYDGSVDSTFGVDGITVSGFSSNTDASYSLAIQEDGKIVAGGFNWDYDNGNDFAIARFNSNGTLDHSFSSNGKQMIDFFGSSDVIHSLIIQNDEKILVSGTCHELGVGDDFALARYNSNGTLDDSFGSAGIVVTDMGNENEDGFSLELQNDGKIIVAGGIYTNDGQYDFAIARYINDDVIFIDTIIPVSVSFSCFPNPITGEMLTINTNTSDSVQGEISIFDLLGNKVFQHIVSMPQLSINIKNLSHGMYVVYYKTEDKLEAIKIVKF